MGRQRKSHKNSDADHLNDKPKARDLPNRKMRPMRSKKKLIVLGVIVVIAAVLYYYYNYRLVNMIGSKLDKPNVVNLFGRNVPERYWGSYRSGHYFGLRVRHKLSPAFGLMWFAQKIENNNLQVRHWCNTGDNLKRYGWLKHDGLNFGDQEILDKDVVIRTTFVKRLGGDFGGDWTARISVSPQVNSTPKVPMSLLFYTATNGNGVITPHIENEHNLVSVSGNAEALGNFVLDFSPLSGNIIRYNYLQTIIPQGLEHLKEIVMHNLALFKSKIKDQVQILGLVGKSNKYDGLENQPHDNFIVHQVTFLPPFEMEVVFQSGSFKARPNRLSNDIFLSELKKHSDNFDSKFDKVFQLKGKGFSDEDISIGKAILSNMVGSIGYFYGSSLVQSKNNPEPIVYWPAELYTGVPSRANFPRGFLWDEGFHNLLIGHWDAEISKDILGHWLDLMNSEGWIPREQILGLEARIRVPPEYVVQRNTVANPPALLMSFDVLVHQMLLGKIPTDKDFLQKSFERLKVWFDWFNTTQVGKLPGTYRWRGRATDNPQEVNSKTLASGLDDYPRASHPTEDERHVDLRCWMAYAAQIMRALAELLGQPWKHYEDTHRYLSDNSKLEELHWSSSHKMFSDYGLHTDNVKLVQPKPVVHSPGQIPIKQDKVRVVLSDPQLQYVNSFGYVSLFPLLVHILQPDSPQLGKVLTDLKDPKLLWTNYGLRSLAKNSPLYMKHNSQHDPPYWRGQIWINLNYMVVKALKIYSDLPGPYQEQAFSLYKELRQNLIKNILSEYKRSGYIWEHYNDKTGFGGGAHPFTGWSATVVLMMGELF